uniref:zinc finger E-box-binding homeobox 1b isoform X2 n=1 Tax=Doryrhamphus excisus TaxID=161450 RepID=UPI0025ADAD69|nr:zinc finger E-box-binding homeobox 1b isoform X2 [Doryrhamphus excisus]
MEDREDREDREGMKEEVTPAFRLHRRIMADGPRCKRRKQANPRRNNVKEDCVSDGEDDASTDALVEEMLQQGDTAVIYPEAPEDELQRHGTPDASVPDENGTPDSFSQLLTCPYCARGYKRYSSLKEHIKYRHEKTEECFSCPECSYTFAHRAQLERHMTAHKPGRDQRHITQTGGNRKFKCTECGKAFKYKHHLKEHLRIHSGEKPYECSNCKKRFSHSGSYSSHISSKKCISLISVNGRPRLSNSKGQGQAPPPILPTSPSVLRAQIREKLEHSKPLQEQLPLNQIKSEPPDYEYKAAVMTSPAVAAVNGGMYNGGAGAPLQGTVQAVVLPTVGLMSPISINIADLQNALKVAVDGSVIRQVLESNAKGQPGQAALGLTTGTIHPSQQQLISAISLPIVGQDGNAKIIINYNLEPNQGQLTAQNLKKESEPFSGQPSTEAFKCQKLPEDLTIKGVRAAEMKEEDKTTKTCLLCDSCPAGDVALEALHALKHCKKEALRLNGGESAVAALLSEGGFCDQPKNLLSLLKAYFALNAEPTKDELAKISDSVSLPVHVVKRWFDKMQEGQISLGAPTPPSEEDEAYDTGRVVSPVQGKGLNSASPSATRDSPTEASPAELNGPHGAPASPLPLSLKGLEDRPPQIPDAPLDLSLPKPDKEETGTAGVKAGTHPPLFSVRTNQEEPLNLTCTKKDASPLSSLGASPVALYAAPPSANPLNIVTAQLPALVAIADQGRMQCLRALTAANKQTILIPQLAYTYTTSAGSPAGADAHETIHLNGIKEEKQDAGLEGMEGTEGTEEHNDSDSGPLRKKMKKTEGGLYACDLCDKIFQKSSSLLRHKYEHTGKRPHECSICTKAFKHKHHLIEHMRLHSGEKPYQCDKCGKRFSHSGSYSQHMNHRYSYCKKESPSQGRGRDSPEGDIPGPAPDSRLVAFQVDSDERGSSAREDEESEEFEEEFEEEEEDGAVDVKDIQVVQVGEEDEAENTGDAEEEDGRREETEVTGGAAGERKTCEDEDEGD